jgi:5-methylcytosine-specific restriction endonuclease McrA
MKRNYDDPAYADWRRKILKRDNKTCKMPGCQSKTRLQVHHIRKWASASALRYELSNGITLCSTCHKSISGKEHHYESLFMELINGV